MALLSATPALPVSNTERAVAFYRTRLGFTVRHEEASFAVLDRDEVTINLWEANGGPGSGAEPHLAGSASCRIRVSGIDALYDECRKERVVHPNGPLTAQWWGDRDFTILDADGNAIAFFEPNPNASEPPSPS